MIFNRFLFLTDFLYTAEGLDYVAVIKDIFNGSVILQISVLVFTGIIGIIIFPVFKRGNQFMMKRILAVVVVVVGIIMTPFLYQFNVNSIVDARYEYETFTSSGFDMELTGLYQYIARDCWMTFLKPKEDNSELKEMIRNYFDQKEEHQKNTMTGFLKEKNVIIFQMETIDDWMINETDTPNIYKLMHEGINFTGMYTPCYGTGWTFGTEFAFNTGVYQGSTVLSGERLARNHFPYSMANIAAKLGYTCNSLHENLGSYYSRSSMHNVLGYEYHCSRDYLDEAEFHLDDTTLIENDKCWRILTDRKPFFSFVITMSAHLPYDAEGETVKYALSKYPEYSNTENEVNNLKLMARLTDDMFGALIRRVKEDNLLKDTVIIAYDDHYSYGLSDKEVLTELSEEAGDPILEKTPAFIWYDGCIPQEVTKTIQTIDWLPTIANMFDVEIDDNLLGNDIFDENYTGYAIFPDNTWKYDDCYVRSGAVVNQGSISSSEVIQKKELVRQFYEVNNAILESDYYADSTIETKE